MISDGSARASLSVVNCPIVDRDEPRNAVRNNHKVGLAPGSEEATQQLFRRHTHINIASQASARSLTEALFATNRHPVCAFILCRTQMMANGSISKAGTIHFKAYAVYSMGQALGYLASGPP